MSGCLGKPSYKVLKFLKKNSYDKISRISQGNDWFLNYIEYDASKLDHQKANNYFKKTNEIVGYGGMCTGVHSGSRVLRQLDWYYDNCAEFVVRMKKCVEKGVLYDSIGVTAASPKILVTDDIPEYDVKRMINNKVYNSYFDILPYETVDGVNEKGIFAQSNVVEKNDVQTINIGEGKEDCCCSIMLVRYILDRLDSLDNLETLLDSLHLYNIDPRFMTYNTHILVGDADGNTKIIEFESESYDIIDNLNTMTNFRVNRGFETNPFGMPNWGTIEQNGQGVERFGLGQRFFIQHPNPTMEDFKDLRKDLHFTNAYLSAVNQEQSENWFYSWFTDNLSGDLSAGGLSVYDAAQYHSQYDDFVRDHPDRKKLMDDSLSSGWIDFRDRSRSTGKTWHTTHSCIYDLINLSCNIEYQESGICYNVLSDGTVSQDL